MQTAVKVETDHRSETPLWEMLAGDVDRPIVVLNEDGRITYANETAVEHVNMSSAADLIGKSMEEVCEPEYARERLGIVREVIRSGRTIAVEGMTRGVWRRTIIRAVPGTRSALLVHIPVPKSAAGVPVESGYEVRRAKIDDFGPLGTLSEREMEVLRLIAEGKTTAEIAKALHRSVKTVEWHRVSLGTKLGVTNRVELARIAIRCGLVGVDGTITPGRVVRNGRADEVQAIG